MSTKPLQRIRRARRQLLQQADRLDRARHRQLRVLRQFGELRQRGRADFALRRLHRAQECRVVVGIGDQPQPRHRILDLAAIQERGAAGQVIRHAQQLQRFLQRPRLVVAAEQDAEIAPRRLPRLVQEMDLVGDLLRFVRGVAAFPDADALAIGLVAPQRLRDVRAGCSRSARWPRAARGCCSGSSVRA